ncbi:MAG: shikimate dehydrogenase, partial [Ilumatobacteraceae bacterium]
TTPVGMGGSGSPASDPLPIDAQLLRAGQVVADIVYHPRRTAFLTAASAAGAATVEGLGMLVHQAAIQQRLWHGHSPDTAVMRTAADHELAARGR